MGQGIGSGSGMSHAQDRAWAYMASLNNDTNAPANAYWRNPDSVGEAYSARGQKAASNWAGGLQAGYSYTPSEGAQVVGYDYKVNTVQNTRLKKPRTTYHYDGEGLKPIYRAAPAPPAAAPAPEPKPPVIEAKPAPAFDASAYSKPAATTPGRPRYELNTRASGYEEWLARNRPGGGSSDGSQPDTPSTGGGGGGDRVRFYQDKLMGGEPGAASAGHYSEASRAGNGGQRMAGSRQFKERLSRYRS